MTTPSIIAKDKDNQNNDKLYTDNKNDNQQIILMSENNDNS